MSRRSLGEDLETEILVRLPAKSLMRFKCVQRSWNLLFKTHAFVTRHRNMHVFDEDHHHLMILHIHIYKNCLTTLLSTHDDDPTPKPKPKPKLEFNPFFFPNIIYGHCNGVFCLQEDNQNNKILWNPTTREVHVIPPPPSFYPSSDNFFGFGADPNTNNFKVVKLSFSVNKYKWWYSNLLSVEIYSLSSKSWSLIRRPALPLVRGRYIDPNKYNTLVNGVYHWIMVSKLECFPSILCFDFSNNQFSVLRPPISNYDDGATNLAEINGSLAYVVEYKFSLKIWVMGQQGWDKKYSIGPLDGISRIHAIWKKKKKGKDDGAQVLASSVDRQALTLYDQDGNSVRQLQIDLESSPFSVHEYVPSIAPLSAWQSGKNEMQDCECCLDPLPIIIAK